MARPRPQKRCSAPLRSGGTPGSADAGRDWRAHASDRARGRRTMRRWKKLLMTGGGLGAAALALPRLRARSLPLRVSHPGRALPFAGLGVSLRDELDQPARVEGRLPAALRGTLYINGPGLFDRGGRRKRNLLDGDGLITGFTIGDGVRVRARFVRTDKLGDEARGRTLPVRHLDHAEARRAAAQPGREVPPAWPGGRDGQALGRPAVRLRRGRAALGGGSRDPGHARVRHLGAA